MSRQKDRDEFIAIATREGLTVDAARALMRYSTTLQRLAEAQCNGDYPADNGERKVKQCPRCEQLWVPSFFVRSPAQPCYPKICRECRINELVRAVLPAGFEPIFQGDPRGCVLKLKIPSGRTNDWGQEGICVP